MIPPEKEKGEAQAATNKRDTYLDKLDEWFGDFREIVTIALDDSPQWREKPGFLERTRKGPSETSWDLLCTEDPRTTLQKVIRYILLPNVVDSAVYAGHPTSIPAVRTFRRPENQSPERG